MLFHILPDITIRNGKKGNQAVRMSTYIAVLSIRVSCCEIRTMGPR